MIQLYIHQQTSKPGDAYGRYTLYGPFSQLSSPVNPDQTSPDEYSRILMIQMEIERLTSSMNQKDYTSRCPLNFSGAKYRCC